MSKFQRSDVPLFICKNCPALKGLGEIGERNKDFILAWRSRCVLCGRKMDSLGTTETLLASAKKKGKGKKGVKLPPGAMRFPRLLAANPEQAKIVEIIENRTRDFDAPGKITEVHIGPVVTEYEFTPDKFTRFRTVKGLRDDMQMALAAQSCIISAIPGKPAMAFSIPNETRQEVQFAETVKGVIKHRDDMHIPINMGVDIRGNTVTVDLTDMPHLLVAGATNAGKSVFLANLLGSILSTRTPKQVQFVLIDPKQVELFPYGGIPQLWNGLKPTAGIFEALQHLELLIQETKRRTSIFHQAGVKTLAEYNDLVKKEVAELKAAMLHEQALKREATLLPYIVLVIDEMAELMLQAKKDFTERMASIVAMSRAAGIHVIAATQRPSVDVLPGKIKTNFPARVAFRLPSAADSKTVIMGAGADLLLGQGDMLFINPTLAGIHRMHGPNIKKEETERILKIVTELQTLPADYKGPDPMVDLKAAIDWHHTNQLKAAGVIPPAVPSPAKKALVN